MAAQLLPDSSRSAHPSRASVPPTDPPPLPRQPSIFNCCPSLSHSLRATWFPLSPPAELAPPIKYPLYVLPRKDNFRVKLNFTLGPTAVSLKPLHLVYIFTPGDLLIDIGFDKLPYPYLISELALTSGSVDFLLFASSLFCEQRYTVPLQVHNLLLIFHLSNH